MSEGSEKKRYVNWLHVLWYIHLDALGLYGLFLLLTDAKWLTVIFALFVVLLAHLGVTVGAHRLWTHRTFVASKYLRVFLVLGHTLAGVGPIYDWVLSHRLHHRFYGTDADPYNHKKGFLYSHFVANVMSEHPEREKLARDIDMRDACLDYLVWIQHKFYWILFPLIGVLLPINAPVEYWGESTMNSVFIVGFMRLAIATHVSWLVNSAMLVWGLNPGDKYPADSNSVFFLRKSYWLNYHYTLPWDWRSDEFGAYERDFGSIFIKVCEVLDLATELKSPSSEAIRNAIGEAATSKKSIDECLKEVEKLAAEEAIKTKLMYRH